MHCGVAFCIYNRKYICIRNGMQLDLFGNCMNCLFVQLDEVYLEAQKQRQLEDIEEKTATWRRAMAALPGGAAQEK